MGLVSLAAVNLLLVMQAAQGLQATVSGTIRDGESGVPIAGAAIVMADLNRTTSTDPQGHYSLAGIPAGPQHILVRFIGHTPRTLHALVPSAGKLEINVSLMPQPVRLPTVEVRPPVAVRGLEGDDRADYPDRRLSMAAVRNHPLLSEPDAFQALEGGEVVIAPESPNGVHVRGGASDQTAYLLDDIPVFNPFHAAGVFSAWNPDALGALSLTSFAAWPASPATLSGTISGETRTPGLRAGAQGGVSTTQARLTLDGPIGSAGAGYLVSVRSGFPEGLTSKKEASYLRNESGDVLGKLEAPVLGGRVRLLGYDNENEVSATAAPRSGIPPGTPNRNVFEWHSRSMGAEWRRRFSGADIRIIGWSARGESGAGWVAELAGVRMNADRRDEGVVIAMESGSERAGTVLGLRLERSWTGYHLASDSAALAWGLEASTPVGTAFADLTRSVGSSTAITIGASLAASGGSLYPAPRATIQFATSDRVTLTGSVTRNHQFVQSLRNPESIVGNIFPAELYMGAGASGVPVARSDLGVIAAEYRASAGLRVGVQVFARGFDNLLLVAPHEGEPFSSGEFTVGSGSAHGVSFDAALNSARVGLVASYGLQEVRFDDRAGSYVPTYGTTHLFEGGVIVFPAATASVRLGVTGGSGRRATGVSGDFEWEACNLVDQGCEFGGSPRADGGALGETHLPSYFRVDLGVRKHWHIPVGGRDAMVALFGTATNLFGRRNVLTYTRSPTTGQLTPVEMRPLAPLVVGLDWRF